MAWKVVIGIFSILIGVMAFQNCAGGGSSSAPTSVTYGCADTGMVGSWVGTVSGNPDILTVASNCALSSTYCTSSSTYTITSLNTDCPPGMYACGYGEVRTAASNGNANCFSPNSSGNCSFGLQIVGGVDTLYYNCGGGTFTYTRQ